MFCLTVEQWNAFTMRSSSMGRNEAMTDSPASFVSPLVSYINVRLDELTYPNLLLTLFLSGNPT